MKTIAITGATGFIGRYLIAELSRLGGYEIRILCRDQNSINEQKKAGLGVRVFIGDLTDPATLEPFICSNCTVINLAYLWGAGVGANLTAVQELTRACSRAGARRLIHLSSAVVAGRAEGNIVTESSVCCPHGEYAATKLEIERVIVSEAKQDLETIILRPTAVFGPGGLNLRKLANDLLNGSRSLNYIKSCLFRNRRLNLVNVANVVGAIVFLINASQTFNGDVFIISDDDSAINNFSDVEDHLIQIFEMATYPMGRVPIPSALLRVLLILLNRNEVNPLVAYSPNKLLALGFERPMGFEKGLMEFATWFLSEQGKNRRSVS